MPPEVCPEHSGMIERTKNIDEKCDAILTELRSTKKDLWDKVNKHIDDAEKPGGRQDRLLLAEQAVATMQNQIICLKKQIWLAGSIGGFIGGLLAKAAPEAFTWVMKIIAG